jgi:hypothetical protein
MIDEVSHPYKTTGKSCVEYSVNAVMRGMADFL